MKRTLIIAAAALLLAGCQKTPEDTEAGASATAPPEVRAESGDVTPAPPTSTWRAELVEVERSLGTKGAEITRGDATSPAATGGELGAGESLRTDAGSRAQLQAEDGTQITLNHSSEVAFTSGAALRLGRGQILIDRPVQAGEARLELPGGGALKLGRGAKLSVVARDDGAHVTVSRGEVSVEGSEVSARAGDALTVPREGAPRTTHTPDLARAMGWSSLGAEAVSVPRGIGQLYAQRPGGGSRKPLELTRHEVTVRVQGAMAYTEITESFHNSDPDTLEGVYRFPLPAGAQISRLRLKVDGAWQEGVFVENARAARIWKEVIRDWRDPAWLRWQHGDQFELRIFPIDGNSTRTISIGYTQRLEPTDGGRRYVYPMPVDTEGVAGAGVFSIDARVQGVAQGVRVEGYEATVTPEAGATAVTFEAKDFNPAGDFALRVPLAEDDRVVQTATYRNPKRPDEDAFALLALRPELPDTTQVRGRDFLAVLDASHTRSGKAWELQNTLVVQLARELDPLDTLAVIRCAERCEPVGEPGFRAGGPQRAAALQSALGAISPGGTSNLLEALSVSAELFKARTAEARTSRAPQLILMSDGVASAGPLDASVISAQAQRLLTPLELAGASVVDLGGSSDPLVLRALALASGGAVVTLDPAEPLAAAALRVLSYHLGETLVDVRVELPPGLEQVYPEAHMSVPAGGEILLTGRLTESVTGDVVVRGRVGDQPFEARYPVQLAPNESRRNAYIPRLWAEQRIADLELDDTGDHTREIVALSLEHGLLSRHTSLMALESEDMRREFGLDRDRSVATWQGDEEPEEEASAAEAEPMPRKRSKKKSSPRSAAKPSKDNSGIMGKGSAGEDLFDPVPRRSRRRPWRVRWSATIRPFDGVGEAEKRIQSLREKIAEEPDARDHRKALIRKLAYVGKLDEARVESNAWLDRNPMDPEALILAMELDLRQGQPTVAERRLASATDTSPRAAWLQRRLVDAYDAAGQHALACHQRSALAALDRKVEAPVECAIASDMTRFGLSTQPSAETHEPRKAPRVKKRDRHIHATLTWSGQADLGLTFIEPSGRALSWLGGSSRLDFGAVHAPGEEVLSLRKARSGTYLVEVFRHDDGQQAHQATLEVHFEGSSETFPITLEGGARTAVEVDIEKKRARR